ncbi:MAG: hypothetical protein HYV28_19715, partial [Ignavibacteriales bacterium]|nr:hypothetical protein [Ignavibacteriales bacterium]
IERAESYSTGGSFMPLDALGATGQNSTQAENVEPPKTDEEAQNQKQQGTEDQGGSGSGSLLGKADTSSLKGVYSEPSLGVSIRYPNGWTYLDQSLRKKLDGITFLGTPTANGEVPYVHVKVQEKYLFNPSRYKSNSPEEKFTLYFNDPEILEGQYSLEMYVRTETDNDFMIKLIIHSEAAYKEFNPVFLAMVKTFGYKGKL